MFPFILLVVVLVANALLGGVAVALPHVVDAISVSARRGLLLVSCLALLNLIAALIFYYIYAHEFHQ